MEMIKGGTMPVFTGSPQLLDPRTSGDCWRKASLKCSRSTGTPRFARSLDLQAKVFRNYPMKCEISPWEKNDRLLHFHVYRVCKHDHIVTTHKIHVMCCVYYHPLFTVCIGNYIAIYLLAVSDCWVVHYIQSRIKNFHSGMKKFWIFPLFRKKKMFVLGLKLYNFISDEMMRPWLSSVWNINLLDYWIYII